MPNVTDIPVDLVSSIPDLKMSGEQTPFVFSKDSLEKITEILSHYPLNHKQSAVLPLLDLAQRQCGGWLPTAAIVTVADILEMPFIRVFEVATFYTMFNLKKVGKYHLKVCGTTPCWLKGASDLMQACEKQLGIKKDGSTADGMFTLSEFECLGACVNAPVVQINDDYIEDLTVESLTQLLDDLKAGAVLQAQSIEGRQGSKAKDRKF